MSTSFADILAAAQQMITALQANQSEVASRGADAGFVADGQAKLARAQALDAEQERLKAELKVKTAGLDTAVADLKAWQSEAASAVKLAYRDQQEKWVEFGIKAKR